MEDKLDLKDGVKVKPTKRRGRRKKEPEQKVENSVKEEPKKEEPKKEVKEPAKEEVKELAKEEVKEPAKVEDTAKPKPKRRRRVRQRLILIALRPDNWRKLKRGQSIEVKELTKLDIRDIRLKAFTLRRR